MLERGLENLESRKHSNTVNNVNLSDMSKQVNLLIKSYKRMPLSTFPSWTIKKKKEILDEWKPLQSYERCWLCLFSFIQYLQCRSINVTTTPSYYRRAYCQGWLAVELIYQQVSLPRWADIMGLSFSMLWGPLYWWHKTPGSQYFSQT